MNNNIQNKLLQYEVQPPEGAWNRIASALDDDPLQALKNKMVQSEVQPPASTWNRIASTLDAQPPVSLQPSKKPYVRLLRYGAAAAAVLIIFFSSRLLSGRQDETLPPATTTVQQNSTQQINIATTPSVNSDHADEELIAVHDMQKQRPRSQGTARRPSREMDYDHMNISAYAGKLIPDVAESRHIISHQLADKYMIFSREDGNPVKLPRRLFDAVACAAFDIECKVKLKQVQEKFAASAMTADFTGVLDILSNMGENQ